MRPIQIFCFFLFILSFQLKAQDTIISNKIETAQNTNTAISPVKFDQQKIAKYKSSNDFKYLEKAENDSWWTRFKYWLALKYLQFKNWFFDQFGTSSLVSLFLKVLPYFLLGGLLLLIGWLFSKFNPSSSLLKSSNQPDVLLNEEEEIIRSENIEDLIASAVKDLNYRLAVRYYYLFLLKLLNQKGIIHYEFQKTNSEYLSELKGVEFKEMIKRSIRHYDFIWYGNFSIDRMQFLQAESSFKKLQDNLKTLPDE